MKLFKNFTRKADIFGYPISLNFDEKGYYYNTSIGGILSIIFYLIILTFTGSRLYILTSK